MVGAQPAAGECHDSHQDPRRPGRRPHRGDQPVAGRRGAGGAPHGAGGAHLRRAPRRARHRQRGLRRPDARDQPQPRDGGGHARLGAGLHPRQARPEVLPPDLRGAARARHRPLLLHRRQRLVGHGAHRQRGGAQGRLPAALHPHPQDHRQRPGVQRPHAGLPVGGAFRGPGLRRRQPGQRGAARRLRGGGDGPACRLPDGGLGAGQEVPGRRAAPDLPARARLRRSTASWPTSRPRTSAMAAAWWRCPRASTTRRASRC